MFSDIFIFIYLFILICYVFSGCLCASTTRLSLLKGRDSEATDEANKVVAAAVTLRNKKGILNGGRMTQYL